MRKLLFIMALLSAARVSADPEAFIINNLAETLSKINLETGVVQNHIATLGDTPNQVGFHDGYLYVVNSISANLLKISPIDYQTVADIPFVIGSNPYSFAFDGNYAFVSGWVSGFVYRVNLATNEVDNQIQIGGFPEGLIVLGGKLYAAQTAFNPNDFSYGQGQIARIDPINMILEDEIDVGKNPQSFVRVSNSIFHVICTGNYTDVAGSVYIYDTAAGAVVDSLLIGGQPVNGAVAPGSIVFLAAGGWIDHGFLLAYNAQTRQIINGIDNPVIVGLGAMDVAVDSVGFIYTCNFGDDTVSKISLQGPPYMPFAVGDGPQSIVILDTRINGVNDDVPAPLQISLIGSYPNPFNTQTTIKYSLMGTPRANIEIIDILGRRINSIAVNAGSNRVIWDGTNYRGEVCAAGIYHAVLVTRADGEAIGNNRSNVIRMVYVK
ncbi:MAG: hypothetical protein A2W25_06560 [candidate division Zixibacteria bacterium RBG_16_53_22]|nr:MAG: hypothetical protein A2W25_06560 [candidate division Zixibacteria bacterium RBG_16_53_22]